MMVWQKNMDAYRAQHQGYGHPLTIIMSRKVRKEAKPHGENPPSRKHKAQNFWNNMSSTYPYIHLNQLSQLLLDGRLVEEIMNSMIMCWSVEPARRKRRDSLYLIIWWSRRIIWMILYAIKIWSEKIVWNGK